MIEINARKKVLEVLNACETSYVNDQVQLVHQQDYSELDKRFISRIVYGVVENKIYLDYVIRQFSSVRLKKIEPEILNVLRMSAYQILFMDKTPDSAAVNEGVKLAKKIHFRRSGFVNGLLRNLVRDQDNIKMPKERIPFLSVQYSHPEFLVSRWTDLFGDSFTEDLLKSNNVTPYLSIRVNTLKTNREDLITKLESTGVKCKKSDIVKDGIIITDSKALSLEHNDDFKQGHFTVQDESSMFVSEQLQPNKGERILDLCAAPGGKSTHLAQLMADDGEVVSCDVSDYKLSKIQENINRLGFKSIKPMINDGLIHNNDFDDAFDKVLVDAPCSGLGIIRRKPDIKYLKSMESIESLQEIQLNILNQAAKYVKIGGVLMYSTCTIEPLENNNIIETFLKTHPEYERVLIDGEKFVQLYPNVHETDGFFCCKMLRK